MRPLIPSPLEQTFRMLADWDAISGMSVSFPQRLPESSAGTPLGWAEGRVTTYLSVLVAKNRLRLTLDCFRAYSQFLTIGPKVCSYKPAGRFSLGSDTRVCNAYIAL